MAWVTYVPIQGCNVRPSLSISPTGNIGLRKSLTKFLLKTSTRFDVLYDADAKGILLVPSPSGTFKVPTDSSVHGGVAQAVKLLGVINPLTVTSVEGIIGKDGSMAFDFKRFTQ